MCTYITAAMKHLVTRVYCVLVHMLACCVTKAPPLVSVEHRHFHSGFSQSGFYHQSSPIPGYESQSHHQGDRKRAKRSCAPWSRCRMSSLNLFSADRWGFQDWSFEESLTENGLSTVLQSFYHVFLPPKGYGATERWKQLEAHLQ